MKSTGEAIHFIADLDDPFSAKFIREQKLVFDESNGCFKNHLNYSDCLLLSQIYK